MRLAANVIYPDKGLTLTVKGGNTAQMLPLTWDPAVYGGLPNASFTVSGPITDSWSVQVEQIDSALGKGAGTTRLDPAKVLDFGLVFFFQ